MVVFLLALAFLRWPPISAEPPLDVRALPLFLPAIVLAIAAALAGPPDRGPGAVRPAAVALIVAVVLLVVVSALRPPSGLVAVVSGPTGEIARLPRGAIDVTGPALRDLPGVHRWTFRWQGPLRAPATGTYRLWAAGRGEIEVRLDDWPVLSAAGEPLSAGADLAMTEGSHAVDVTLRRVGPGPRLKLGWRRPDGRTEVIPPRFLGSEVSRLWWVATDLLAVVVAALLAALAWAIPWDRRRALDPAGPPSPREVALSLAGHAVLVAIMSWPLVLDLAGSGVMDRPDGRLNAWILAWDVHALLHAPTRLFQAPIFHPLPDTLAFSENLLLPAVAAAPAILAGGPVLGYNLVLLASCALSGLGAQLLVRRASGDRLAAFVGGAIFAVGAHRWVRLAHLHAQVTVFMPFALLALDRFWERRTLRRALIVGLLVTLQGLSSIYLGAMTALAVAAAAVAMGRRCGRLLAGFALAAVLLTPVAAPYMRMRQFQGMEWSLDDVSTYAATLESYAASGTRLYGPLTQRHLAPERVRDTLFPGVVALALGIAGLASAPRRYRVAALAVSVAAIVYSLGPATPVYRFLHEHLVFVRGLRALSRFSLVAVLALSVLAGLALSGRRRLAVAALVLMVIESANVPIRYARAPAPSPAAQWLAGREGAVAVLPLGERDTEVMLEGVAHFRPLVNGDSGFMPRPYARAMELLEGPIAEDGLRLLRAVGVSHVVSRGAQPLPVAAAFGDERIYAVTTGETAHVVGAAAPVATLWAGDGLLLDLGTVAEVRRVTFEVSEAPWVPQPWLEVSADGRSWAAVKAEAALADATLSLMRDPRHGAGELRFTAQARYLRVDPKLPARPGPLGVEVAVDGPGGKGRREGVAKASVDLHLTSR
ncbi:MAG TPA: hypothetical protein VGN09_28305 [Vicinamibacteria bacterium]